MFSLFVKKRYFKVNENYQKSFLFIITKVKKIDLSIDFWHEFFNMHLFTFEDT